MGNYFFKEQEKEMSVVVVNKERELDVYLNVYANSSDQLIELVGTNSGHYSIIIDRNGESDDDQHPVGIEIHLVMMRPNISNETGFSGAPRNHNSSKLIKTVKVEQCSGDMYWGRNNNCHNYARFCLESLHLSWPNSVLSPADDYPFLLEVLKIQKCTIGTNSDHYSIIIDRNGESDDDQHPVGTEIHLVMKRPNFSNETGFCCAPRI
ncbi:hypothetical protein ACTFIZ_000683 [Dictyostelium cf. discoideum]